MNSVCTVLLYLFSFYVIVINAHLSRRSKRVWLDDLPLTSHQAYLGDICTNTSKCVVPFSICVPSENIYWNRQSFCVCSAGYRPATGHCIEEIENSTDNDKDLNLKTYNRLSLSSTNGKIVTSGKNVGTTTSAYGEKQTIERNAATVIPAFFSKLKLSNKTQNFISTVVHQLTSLQVDSGASGVEEEDASEIFQLPPPPDLNSYTVTGHEKDTVCVGPYCNPSRTDVADATTSVPSSKTTAVTKTTASTSSSDTASTALQNFTENFQPASSTLDNSIEGLLANKPTKPKPNFEFGHFSGDFAGTTVPSGASHQTTTGTTFIVGSNRFLSNPSKLLLPNIKSKQTDASSSKLDEDYYYDSSSSLPTTSKPTFRTSESESEYKSKFRFVISPQDLARHIDLYSILKEAAEDVMKQYLTVLLSNNTVFPRQWADISGKHSAKSFVPANRNQQLQYALNGNVSLASLLLNTTNTSVAVKAENDTIKPPGVTLSGFSMPFVAPPTALPTSKTTKSTVEEIATKLTSRAFVFKIINKTPTKSSKVLLSG